MSDQIAVLGGGREMRFYVQMGKIGVHRARQSVQVEKCAGDRQEK